MNFFSIRTHIGNSQNFCSKVNKTWWNDGFTVVILGRFPRFRLEWTIKVTTTTAVTFAVTPLCVVKFALRADRLLSFANWSVGVENMGRLSDTMRSQKPPQKFTHALSVYSGATSAQACAKTKENSDKVKNEGTMDRPTYIRTGNARIKVPFVFRDTVAEIWAAGTSRCVKTYRRWQCTTIVAILIFGIKGKGFLCVINVYLFYLCLKRHY